MSSPIKTLFTAEQCDQVIFINLFGTPSRKYQNRFENLLSNKLFKLLHTLESSLWRRLFFMYYFFLFRQIEIFFIDQIHC